MLDKSGGLLVLAIGGCLALGLGGAYAVGAPSVSELRSEPTPAATATLHPEVTASPEATAPAPTPAPLTLTGYVLAADAVCNAAFAESQAVNLSADQQLVNALVTRQTSAALEVRTAQSLLDLPRPDDPAVGPVPAAITGHRDAYAALATAALDDGRPVDVRGAAVAAAQPAAAAAAAVSGKLFADLGSKRCAAWLNPAALKDTGAS